MTDSLPCGVCRRPVYFDEEYVEVTVEHHLPHDRDEMETYYLHRDCSRATSEGWRSP